MFHQPSSCHGMATWLYGIVLAGVVVGVVACSDKTDRQTEGQGVSNQAAPASAAKPGQTDVSKLRESAAKAMTDQRLYAPQGANAMEDYLALRELLPGDATVSSALTDLMPYALIAAEQDIAAGNAAEAQRLYALMERVDPEAPALPRLRDAMNQMKSAAVAQQTDAPAVPAEEQPAAPATVPGAAKDVAARGASVEPPAPTPANAPAPVVPAPAAEAKPVNTTAARGMPSPAAANPSTDASRPGAITTTTQPSATKAGASVPDPVTAPGEGDAAAPAAAAATSPLRVLRTQAPTYPSEALSEGISGEVVVEFTVTTDGSVRDARVVQANPPRVFNQATLAAVRRWRFAPVDAPVHTRRSISFKPDE